jgi:hypothetical protein
MAIPITPSVLETLVSYVTTLHTCTSIYADQYPTGYEPHTPLGQSQNNPTLSLQRYNRHTELQIEVHNNNTPSKRLLYLSTHFKSVYHNNKAVCSLLQTVSSISQQPPVQNKRLLALNTYLNTYNTVDRVPRPALLRLLEITALGAFYQLPLSSTRGLSAGEHLKIKTRAQLNRCKRSKRICVPVTSPCAQRALANLSRDS